MTLGTMSFILGAVLLLAGILGGGFEVKELKIPKISGIARILAMVAGLSFIVLGFISESCTKAYLSSMSDPPFSYINQ